MTTMIRVDTAELTEAVETLRAAAVEAADIGAGLWSCAQCPMPAAVQGLVDQVVAAADQALDAAATQLGAQAVDLLNRAIIAQHDSLTAAGVTTPAGGPALIGGVGSYSDSVHVEPRRYSASLVGGVGSYSDAVHSSPMPWGASRLGGVRHTSLDPYGFAAINEVVSAGLDRQQAAIDAGFRTPNLSAADLNALLEIQVNQGNTLRTVLAPSRSSFEARVGGTLTQSELRRWSPYTLYGIG